MLPLVMLRENCKIVYPVEKSSETHVEGDHHKDDFTLDNVWCVMIDWACFQDYCHVTKVTTIVSRSPVMWQSRDSVSWQYRVSL